MTELEEILADLCNIHNRVLNYGQDILADRIEEVIDRLEGYIEEIE